MVEQIFHTAAEGCFLKKTRSTQRNEGQNGIDNSSRQESHRLFMLRTYKNPVMKQLSEKLTHAASLYFEEEFLLSLSEK